MKTHVITTGGTIGGVDDDLKEHEVAEKRRRDISSFMEMARVDFGYRINKAFNKDSRLITDDDRKRLERMIRSSDEDKILITHGTYTMERTAGYLGEPDLNKTIVLTGAFVLSFCENTDAAFNLGYAIAALQFLDKGVYVAMHGRVFNWDNVYKNPEENRFMPLKM